MYHAIRKAGINIVNVKKCPSVCEFIVLLDYNIIFFTFTTHENKKQRSTIKKIFTDSQPGHILSIFFKSG